MVQFTLFAIAFLLKKDNNRQANIFLAMFAFAKVLCISSMLTYQYFDITFTFFPHAFIFGRSFTILWGPLLYLYTRALTQQNFRFKRLDLLHFFVPFCDLLFWSIRFHFHSAATKRILISSEGLYPPLYLHLYSAYLVISIFVYTILSLVMVWQYRKYLKEHISNIGKYNLSWLYVVLFGFLAKWLLDAIIILHQWFPLGVLKESFYASRIILFLFVSILLLKSMLQTNLQYRYETKPRYQSSRLSKAEMQEYLNRLNQYMRKAKPYLDPDITLPVLARQTDIPARYLSQIINESLNKNFYDFINSYRIEESLQHLKRTHVEKRTVLEVLYDVGFNSKSAFNTAFKNHTGMTPTQFIRSGQA